MRKTNLKSIDGSGDSSQKSFEQTEDTSSARILAVYEAEVTQVMDADLYEIRVGNSLRKAKLGILSPPLVVGDLVSACKVVSEEVEFSISSVLVPHPASPLNTRPIQLTSKQSITLTTGAVTLKLTAAGLARIVAYAIEQDARDLVDIDAGEVRIN
jgi:hypothetical protein